MVPGRAGVAVQLDFCADSLALAKAHAAQVAGHAEAHPEWPRLFVLWVTKRPSGSSLLSWRVV